MHILIEGFDGTGKTSLAESLALATGWLVIHQSPKPIREAHELERVSRKAIQSGIDRTDLISDRWPLISEYCYAGEGSLLRISTSLKLGNVSRIIHCDVDRIGELRIEPRPGDEADRLQSIAVVAQAGAVLARYRHLMAELKELGHDVRRYKMKG